MLGSFFRAYPTTGSFSRSAVNNETGAKSAISAIVTATLVAFTLLFLTPLFRFMPKSALAAIVVSSVVGLVDYDEAMFLWRISKKDWLLWMFAFLGTLFLGVELGIGIAVALSLVFVVYETARPNTAILGQLPGSDVYRSIKQYPKALTREGMVILRFDAQVYFANVEYFKEQLRRLETFSMKELKVQEVKFVVLEMGPVISLDSTAVHAFKEIIGEYKSRGITLVLSNPSSKVRCSDIRDLAPAW
eukprot:scaffold4756_cov357-Prasinococcus_capsulatus_cf.AAC.7